MEIIKIIVLFADAALFVLMCVMIYRLQKKVDKLDEQLNAKNTVFRISENDLVGVLEKQTKPTKPAKPENEKSQF